MDALASLSRLHARGRWTGRQGEYVGSLDRLRVEALEASLVCDTKIIFKTIVILLDFINIHLLS